MAVEIKNMVLDSARRLIGRNGLSNLSISKVAQEADISKSHVYYYFDSKRDLIDQLIDEEIEKYSLIKESINESDSIPRKLTILFDYVQNQINEDDADYARGSILITLAMETAGNEPLLNQKLRYFSNTILEDVYMLIKESGYFQTDEEERTYARKVFAMILGVLVMARVTNNQSSIDYLKEDLIAQFTK
ncbi:TetR/AcrR family transcriptional regulator [Weissella muntiaci]|uniref:TetR/AcrR family transcriptional regulator n=1 Tax=Weissella muntiaci TaxID=2508881 RepID=A0A6C2C128_9LACO|nr:TetR/AcrR family transcriptional regulator [Weissella muntiaci]TYC47750.1 TetR/AcrR family transcriptional regulator [Weissella muntiaci]